MPFFGKKRTNSSSSTSSPVVTPKQVTFAPSPTLGVESPTSVRSSSPEFSGSFDAKSEEARHRVANASRDRERSRLLQRHLTQIPKNLFLRRKDLTVSTCTWNVAEAPAQRVANLEKWLQAKRGSDIVAVGLQEVDMRAMAIATSSTGKADPWLDCLSRHLIPYDFKKLASQSLVGITLAVYVRQGLFAQIEHLSVKEVKLGTGGFTGNKGALACSFMLGCKRFMFLNSHFVPHQENCEKRNENFHAVLNQLTQHDTSFSTATNDPCVDLVSFGTTGEKARCASSSVEMGLFGSPKAGQQATVDNSVLGSRDYIFWFGDLNYRVDSSYEEVMHAVAHKKVGNILASDQLLRERSAGKVFADFDEAPITFLPTYKYVKGENIYDTSKKGNKRRVPAYTDRILWYTLKTPMADDFLPAKSNIVTPIKYKVYDHTVSDHHPVSCLLKVAVYYPDHVALDRVVDMSSTGMSPQQIANALAEQFNKTPNEELLYTKTALPPTDTTGPGTCYSSDEDTEGIEQQQRKRMEDRLQALENLLKQGPLPGDETLDEIKIGQNGLQMKVEDLTMKLADLPVAPHEEINLLGESMTHILDRLQSVETLLAESREQGPEPPLTASVTALKTQFTDLANRMDVFISTASAMQPVTDAGTEVPRQYEDDESLDIDERKRRAELRSVFLAGVNAGREAVPNTGLMDPNSIAFEELMEERQASLAKREEDMKAMIQRRELECERRETALREREADVRSRTETLDKLEKVLEERIRAAEALHSTEATAASSLQRREDEVRDQELKILQERARLSAQQLKLKQEIADLEMNRETFTNQLSHKEQALSHRETHLAGVEDRLQGKMYAEEEAAQSPGHKHAWKGVLEGPTTSQSPGRLRGTYTLPSRDRERSRSPLSELLLEHNLYDTSSLADLPMSGYAYERSRSPTGYGYGAHGPSSLPLGTSPSPSPARDDYHHSYPAPLPLPTQQPRRTTKKPVSAAASVPDKLQTTLQHYINDARLPSNFARITVDQKYPGGYIYAFGTRKVTIRLMGETKKEPRVLIGSGWMPFSDFVAKFGDPEQRRLIRSRQLDL
eukprot:TRINITY_DN1835_c0_g2_i1.p1 TRINITY_DN1835_c0_g2~~TRINITY_DN1835_c0_g2_i1.p1  ORF type:complete len:1086 (+),score=317.71 TRINITY_DN1835_c0_g2_i1:41-3259(+)